MPRRAALEKLDTRSVPIAGLAKREEEIYLPDAEEPLRLEQARSGASAAAAGPRRDASLRDHVAPREAKPA